MTPPGAGVPRSRGVVRDTRGSAKASPNHSEGRNKHPNLPTPSVIPSVLLIADRDVRVISEQGELIRHLTTDPSRDYQGRGLG